MIDRLIGFEGGNAAPEQEVLGLILKSGKVLLGFSITKFSVAARRSAHLCLTFQTVQSYSVIKLLV